VHDFYEQFVTLFDTCFPLKKINILNNNNFSVYSSNYLKECSLFLKEWLSFLKENHLPISQDYREMLNFFKRDVIQNRITVNDNKISKLKNKIKTTWDVINQKIKNKNISHNIKLMYNGNLIHFRIMISLLIVSLIIFLPNNLDISKNHNILSYNFSNVSDYPKQHMFLFPTDPHEIKSVILNLPNTTSVGPDNIPTSLIKACVDNICIPLIEMINKIFETGHFPEVFKIAKIIPLFKKGSKLDPMNYRLL
jgi:hypothetical protein